MIDRPETRSFRSDTTELADDRKRRDSFVFGDGIATAQVEPEPQRQETP